jgi:hypothetical protein
VYDKALLGKRYACFQCGTKFYDLNRPEPMCPECGADQREAPVRDIKALLAGRRARSSEEAGDEEEGDDDLDDLGLDEDEDEDLEDEDEDEEFGEDE